jgi:hypothetical protein
MPHSQAFADEPQPTTTVPTPTEPTPDPAPPPKPAAKPKSKPAPAPSQPVSRPRPTRVAPPRSTVASSHPTVRINLSGPAAKKRVFPKKPKPVVQKKRHAKRKVERKQPAPLPKVVAPKKEPRSGVLGAQTESVRHSGESLDFRSLLIAAMLGLAITCFGVAAIPAVHVPWRPIASLTVRRRLDMAIVGLACLALAEFLMLAAGGF